MIVLLFKFIRFGILYETHQQLTTRNFFFVFYFFIFENWSNARHTEPLCPEAPDMLQFKSIEEWLASLKLSRYVDNFQQAGVTTLDAVTRLSHADLSGLGIILLGHQRKIMNSIQAMRAQLSISMSEGFLVWSPLPPYLPTPPLLRQRQKIPFQAKNTHAENWSKWEETTGEDEIWIPNNNNNIFVMVETNKKK